MQKIVPNLWFDHTALEAAQFYTSVFPDSRVVDVQYYPSEGLPDFQVEFAGQPVGVDFELAGYRMSGINAGPEFPINPSVSFLVNFDPSADPEAAAHLDRLWTALAEDGEVLMALDAYPHSERYGWVADRYGVNWQLMLTDPAGEPRPFIIPSLLFCDGVQNRAEAAIDFYTGVFGGRVGTVVRYPEAHGAAAAGSVQFADLELFGQWFAAMDSAVEQDFSFTPGVSLLVRCADQAELDRYWEQVSVVPEAEQCGWCADTFGLSWQFVPANLAELMARPGAFAALMEMKKIEVAGFG